LWCFPKGAMNRWAWSGALEAVLLGAEEASQLPGVGRVAAAGSPVPGPLVVGEAVLEWGIGLGLGPGWAFSVGLGQRCWGAKSRLGLSSIEHSCGRIPRLR